MEISVEIFKSTKTQESLGSEVLNYLFLNFKDEMTNFQGNWIPKQIYHRIPRLPLAT